MFKNYLVTAWRSIRRNTVFSFINIFGLATGLCACMLIVEYVSHEKSFDRFHANANNIFWVHTQVTVGSETFNMAAIDNKFGPMAVQRLPFVQSFARYRREDANTIVQNIATPTLKFAESKFLFADSNFFSFFSFKLLQGNKQQVLANPFSIVISQRVAQKYFGKDNPVGKILRYNNIQNFMVSGVAQNAPSNSSISFDFVAPFSALGAMYKGSLPDDDRSSFTYFLLQHPQDTTKLRAGLEQIDKEGQGGVKVKVLYLPVALTGIHTANTFPGSATTKYGQVFSLVAALILLLAIINYISLSTARSIYRSKEIGVRKVMGAARTTIAVQFFAESALVTAAAFVLGYTLCTMLQPAFFKFLQIDIDNAFLYSPLMLLLFAGLFVTTVVLSATYPAVLLSAYRPVQVLYGRLGKQASGISVRSFFTVVQFTISAGLIVCCIVIQQQMYFVYHADTGVNRSNIVMVPFTQTIGKHLPAFKQQNGALPSTQQISIAQYAMYKGYDIHVYGPPTKPIALPALEVDENFIPMLGLKWKYPPTDPLYYKNKKVSVINEATAETLGLAGNPVNTRPFDAFTVGGVLKDFNYQSLQDKIGPLTLSFENTEDTASFMAQNGGCIFVKLKPGVNTANVLQQMKAIYGQYEKDQPFEYYFMDDTFNQMYHAEEKLSKLFTLFTVFTVIIACLGLFGLSVFMAVQRTKEIGIRKVLGATVTNITVLMSKDFIKLVVIAVVIASPLAWWAMNSWLQGFAYRVQIGWLVFAITTVAAIFIALATVSWQAVRAALANPVDSLRTE